MNYSHEICKSLTVISQMLGHRGIDANNLNHLSVKEIQAIVDSRSIFSVATDDDKIVIVYDLSQKFKWADTKKHVDSLPLDKIDLVIFVVKDASDVNKIKELDAPHQIFDMKELQFNKSTHCLVPKHELIKDAVEINKIVSDYQLRGIAQLPLILKTDPMAKYLYAKPGNVVKVTRISPTCGENIVYRAVV